jgi:uncharacterized protein YjiS (DUF1127 family)
MAYLQSHRDNIIWLGKLSGPPPSRQWIGRACNILGPVLRQFESLAAKSKQRRVRARLLSAQRARQRRALARLPPRELTEIGLSRDDAEIGLQ